MPRNLSAVRLYGSSLVLFQYRLGLWLHLTEAQHQTASERRSRPHALPGSDARQAIVIVTNGSLTGVPSLKPCFQHSLRNLHSLGQVSPVLQKA